MSDDLELVWNGSHKDVYLCVREDAVRSRLEHQVVPVSVPQRLTRAVKYRNLSAERTHVLKLLAERDRWRVSDLRKQVGVNERTLQGVLQRLRRHRVIRSVDYGVVALRCRSAA